MRKKIEWGEEREREREKKEKLTKERELLKERGYEVNRLNNRSKNRNTLSKTWKNVRWLAITRRGEKKKKNSRDFNCKSSTLTD